MMTQPFSIRRDPAPTVVGTGLIALDIIFNGRSAAPLGLWAGGTCGNVLTVLAYLGWKSYPIARLRDDAFANDLIADVRKWKVSPRFLSKTENGTTPIIVERIGKARDGTPRHRFEWNCPTCGASLPRFRAVLARDTDDIKQKLPIANAFFFDRVARSSVDLATHCRKQGALIMFEPSSVKDQRLFEQCVAAADVVKYSHHHASRLPPISAKSGVLLEIETHGGDGLRYRHTDNDGTRSRWKNVGCYEMDKFVDAAGSGDWLTAGLIHQLGQSGRNGLRKTGQKRIELAIEFGQALAAVNCQFDGARGAMYGSSRSAFRKAVGELIAQGKISNSFATVESTIDEGRGMCPECPGAGW